MRQAIILLVLAATGFTSVHAANLLVEPRGSFFTDDFQLGGRVGGETKALDALPIALFADFEFRPYGRATRVRTSPSFSYQFREHRYTFGPGALVSLPVTNSTSLSAGTGFGYTFGDYRGSNRTPEHRWTGWLEGGLWARTSGEGHWGVSYQFRPLPNVSPHRILIAFGWRLSP